MLRSLWLLGAVSCGAIGFRGESPRLPAWGPARRSSRAQGEGESAVLITASEMEKVSFFAVIEKRGYSFASLAARAAWARSASSRMPTAARSQ